MTVVSSSAKNSQAFDRTFLCVDEVQLRYMMSKFCSGLMSASPERPGDNEPCVFSRRKSTDFLHRPTDRELLATSHARSPLCGASFLGHRRLRAAHRRLVGLAFGANRLRGRRARAGAPRSTLRWNGWTGSTIGDYQAETEHSASRSRSVLLCATRRARHGGVTQIILPPANPGRRGKAFARGNGEGLAKMGTEG